MLVRLRASLSLVLAWQSASSSLPVSSSGSTASATSGRLTSTDGVTPECARSSPRKVLPLADAHFTVVSNKTIAAAQGKELLLGSCAETLFADYLTAIALQIALRQRLRPLRPCRYRSTRPPGLKTASLSGSAENVFNALPSRPIV